MYLITSNLKILSLVIYFGVFRLIGQILKQVQDDPSRWAAKKAPCISKEPFAIFSEILNSY